MSTPTASPSSTAEVTPEQLVDIETPTEVKISPDGSCLVYTLCPSSRKGAHKTSSIWIASCDQKHSARQFTLGGFNDRQPQWSPDGKSIIFLSDRMKASKSCAIFKLSILGGEAYAITPAENEQSISRIKFSPDGCFIAYLSADEKSMEKAFKEERRDDAKVYGRDWKYARLRLLHIKTRHLHTLVEGQIHITDLAWAPDSKSIAYITQRTPEIESPRHHGVLIKTLSLVDKRTSEILKFHGPIFGSLTWTQMDSRDLSTRASPNTSLIATAPKQLLCFIAGVNPENPFTAFTFYKLDLVNKVVTKFELLRKDIFDFAATQGTRAEIVFKIRMGLSDCLALEGCDDDNILYIGTSTIASWVCTLMYFLGPCTLIADAVSV
jgi:dipeptidyl aminopeptidase/acylaminoacyl peptidase